jgi:hypothetical protein
VVTNEISPASAITPSITNTENNKIIKKSLEEDGLETRQTSLKIRKANISRRRRLSKRRLEIKMNKIEIRRTKKVNIKARGMGLVEKTLGRSLSKELQTI